MFLAAPRSDGWKWLPRYLASYAVTLALSLPLLLPMFHQSAISGDRSAPLSYGEFAVWSAKLRLWLAGIFGLGTAAASGTDSQAVLERFLPSYSYCGIAVAAGALWAAFVRPRQLPASAKAALVLLVAAVCLGAGYFNRLIYLVPFLNRFRFPYKLLVFASFFLILFGTNGLGRLIAHLKARRLAVTLALVFVLADFSLVYLPGAPRYITRHTDALPLQNPAAAIGQTERVVSVGDADRQPLGGFNDIAAFDYATIWSVPHFGGYQVLIPKENSEHSRLNSAGVITPAEMTAEQLNIFRMWGVRYYLTDNAVVAGFSAKAADFGLHVFSRNSANTIFEDTNALPMAMTGAKGDAVPVRYGINSAVASPACHEGCQVVFNTAYNSFFTGRADGRSAAVIRTAHGQTAVLVPGGTSQVKLVYRDPYLFLGLALSGLSVLGILAFSITRRRKGQAL